MKNFIRKHTDQTFEKMKILTDKSLDNFTSGNTNFKLWRRFWRILALYKDGKSYEEVLKSLFGSKQTGKDSNHLRIRNNLENNN